MMNRYKYKYLLLLPLLLSACRDDSMRLDVGQDGNAMEVRLQAEIDQLNPTRADDSGFADGDVIGVYAVDFSGGQPGTLTVSGNNADNVAFTFDEGSYRWNSSSAILFSDDKTPMDLYGYYPYSKSVDNVEAYPISVEYNQSGDSKVRNMTAYEASDFLWAKSAGLTASNPSTILYFKHVLASVRVTLLEGDGFAENEWNGLDKSVLVCSTSRDATVNLTNGEVKATGAKDSRSIVAKNERGDFRAIVIPQTVNAGADLLNITVGESAYKFKREAAMTFLATKQHIFTIKVNKNTATGDLDFVLEDEAVTPWESDLSSHNGVAKEYLIVKVSQPGTLSSVLQELKYDASEIVNLKIIGPMDESDFEFVREGLTYIESLNMQEVSLAPLNYAIPSYAFYGMYKLRSFIFPYKIERIENESFNTTALCGDLEIPEGVTYIGINAFGGESENGFGETTCFSGSLNLPSTLKVIDDGAFAGCTFTGSLLLPEGIERIGGGAFNGCSNFSGELHLPSSLKSLGFSAFEGMSGIRGWIELPANIDVVDGLSRMSFTGIVWPKSECYIAGDAFRKTEIKTDIKLPDNITRIDMAAFKDAKIRHVELPSGITRISYSCFEGSTLQDTIKIPENVSIIDERAFAFCGQLTAIVLPKNLTLIAESAFWDCMGINHIRCEAIEPPKVEFRAFDGVNKDNFTVEVPEESVEAYRSAPGWSEFKRISAYKDFVARPSKYNVLNKGGKKKIILNANGDWKMIECPSWCHIDKTSGSMKTEINLTVDAMAHGQAPRSGIITFQLSDDDQCFTHIDVGQFDYDYDEDQSIQLQAATKGNGINLVFLGDGYDASDISLGLYIEDMKQEMEYFFGVEPYTSYRDYFNVYTSIALSDDSGVESINQWRNTKFSVCLGDGCSKDGQRLSADWEKALNYCVEYIPQIPQGAEVGCVLVGNTEIYEGITYVGESFCAVVTKSSEAYPFDARGIVQHEAGGHGFGWLGDEYMYHQGFIQSCKCACCKHVTELMADNAIGFSLNVSIVGKFQEVPWAHLIVNPEYSDIVDVYEGGYFHSRGVYRSEMNSCMNNNVPYFSTWSRQLIVERIMKLAGEKFDLNSFYAKDSRATGRDFTSTSRGGNLNVVNAPVRHGNAPVRITGYKFGQKGGRK